ncbi:hypothetical protein LB526_18750 [Mesorhizobium sp. CA6]|uniref:hypothetical protein n=1 Tax=Mesorhizobium sp. CA6 TaxID=588500 RepID=UPI001CCBC77F|nr:hypothetical protein [Mesorhizobium sp. CA6]MBZ9768801.1 hypothetical protein [Mesorhizobium sp. CA6]
MADSDNTTTLPSVTRGRELQSPLAKDDLRDSTTPLIEDQALADPAFVLSLAWIEAHVAMLASCIRQQQAEDVLLERGAPFSSGEVIGRGERDTMDRGYMDRGYVDALAAGQDDAEKADVLLAEIAATPAQSLAGVIAKLAVVVREANDNTDLFEFPLPHVRSALADLQRLTQAATGGQPPGWPAGEQSIGSPFELPTSSFAAWRAFDAWSRGDDDAYRAWTNAFKILQGASQ